MQKHLKKTQSKVSLYTISIQGGVASVINIVMLKLILVICVTVRLLKATHDCRDTLDWQLRV